jgi:hypothetical protein
MTCPKFSIFTGTSLVNTGILQFYNLIRALMQALQTPIGERVDLRS